MRGDSLDYSKETELELARSGKDFGALAKVSSERIQPYADLIGSVVKIAAGVSSVPSALGAVLLISYLHQAGAPLPPFDASIGLFLILIAAALIIAITILSAALVWPFVLKTTKMEVLRPAFPNLYVRKPMTPTWHAFLPSYLTLFAPFISFMVIATIVTSLKWRYLRHPAGGLLEITLSVLAGIFLIWRHMKKTFGLGFKAPGTSSVVTACLMSNFWSLSWASLLVTILIPWLASVSQRASDLIQYLISAALILVIIVFHFFLWRMNFKPISVAAMFLFLLIVFAEIYPGLPCLGGAVLRYFEVGGSLPVSLTLKTSQPETLPTNGCLILSLGGQVSIQTEVNPERCHLIPYFWFQNPQRTSGEVATFQRSDILTITTRAPTLPNKSK